MFRVTNNNYQIIQTFPSETEAFDYLVGIQKENEWFIDEIFEEYYRFFHVTTKDAWDNHIQQEGLYPKFGPRSKDFGETMDAIYLFPSIHDSDSALGSWLGDEFIEECMDEDCDCDGEHEIPLVRLQVLLPVKEYTYISTVPYERVVLQPIPPTYLQFESEQ